MELKLLKTFLAVAELRHFSRAADALHVSQPGLSKQIGALEASLGGKLFERGRHGAELTLFGQAFLPDAQALMRDADDMLARARDASSGRTGQLRIGICLSVLTLVPRLIADFRLQNPGVAITLSDLSSSEQSRRILAGKLDAGFMRLPAASGLTSFRVIDEGLALAMPADIRYKRLPTDLGVLNDIGFIALSRARGPASRRRSTDGAANDVSCRTSRSTRRTCNRCSRPLRRAWASRLSRRARSICYAMQPSCRSTANMRSGAWVWRGHRRKRTRSRPASCAMCARH